MTGGLLLAASYFSGHFDAQVTSSAPTPKTVALKDLVPAPSSEASKRAKALTRARREIARDRDDESVGVSLGLFNSTQTPQPAPQRKKIEVPFRLYSRDPRSPNDPGPIMPSWVPRNGE